MEQKPTPNGKLRTLLPLHLLLLVYSTSGIFSKTAANLPWFSPPFFACYFAVLCILAIYAIGWQQVIKRMPLSTAYANKAVTLAWGLLWSALFFKEAVTPGKVVGVLLVIAGIALSAWAEQEAQSG